MFRCFWLHCCTHVCWFLSYKFYTYIVIEPISPQITNNDISSNTTVEEICDILSSRINDVTLNRSALSGFCPSSNGYMQWNLSTTCLVSAVGIQVSVCPWFVSNWIVWSCGTMLGAWSYSVTTPNSVHLLLLVASSRLLLLLGCLLSKIVDACLPLSAILYEQGIIDSAGTETRQIFFSYVFNGKKIKDFFSLTWNVIAASLLRQSFER